MTAVEKILHVLRLDFAAQAAKEIDRRHEEYASEVALRFSRGNIGIQDGRFLTSEDLDHEISGKSKYMHFRRG